ncbi:NAD(P)-dependent oxidoreductase [Nocardioides silvaticus]|uniref:NAD(P)-dependent oxidoreductase n=1 Tax=Nocardioides silvaticus TaxID=2201891 RepID=A0A316TFG3_9ACTN|nr:NAD(P)-binding domain-containing protein [Nocardioides silvaticus]PWN01242.1 NAD(P)-dependent oxidoreductase [Nocardioides silvaticus]
MNSPTRDLHPRTTRPLSDRTTSSVRRVAVLGLGAMGIALARALAAAGHEVTAWNRSPKDPVALGFDTVGIRVAAAVEDAVAEAEAVLVCVRDHHASRDVLATIASQIEGDVPVVNLSSGTSDQAVASAAAAADLAYVTGAIMVPTPLVGTEDNLVLVAGPAGAVRSAVPVLEGLGGTIDVLGEDHALPPVLDMAMLDMYFAGMYAFLHSAALVRRHGIEPTAYLPYARGLHATLGVELDGLAASFENGTYDGGQASLEMCLSFLEHIVATSEDAGVDPALPLLVRDATRRALATSTGDTDWDVVAEGLAHPA